MAALIPRLLAAALGAAELTRGEYATWHLVDVNSVVCTANGGPGYTDINITFTTQNMDVESMNSPHILTFFRSSNNPVAVALRATDSLGRLVDQRTIDLTKVDPVAGSRRLDTQDEDDEEEEEDDEVEYEEEDDDVYIYELQEEDEEENESPHAGTFANKSDTHALPEVDVPAGEGQKGPAPARLLSARRRSTRGSTRGGSGFRGGATGQRAGGSRTSPSRRRTSSPSAPRRRGVSPRRRGGPTQEQNSRRRGYTPPGVRRRAAGVGGSSYYNKYSPNSGSYAYTSQGRLNNNFGGRPPMSTSYGYSGANAYQASSGTKIAMAAAGGLAVGAAGGYLYSRWATYPGYGYGHGGWGSCHYGSIFSGPCSSCYGMYYSGCYGYYSPPENMARDDLMATGWIPADYTTPLSVRITQVVGQDYTADKICPPPCWHPNKSLDTCSMPWVAPTNQDLYMTLTMVSPLSDDDLTGDDLDDDLEDSIILKITGVVAICCCCAFCVCAIVQLRRDFLDQGPKSTKRGLKKRPEDTQPMAMAPPAVYQAPVQMRYTELVPQSRMVQPMVMQLVAGPGLVAVPYVQEQAYIPGRTF